MEDQRMGRRGYTGRIPGVFVLVMALVMASCGSIGSDASDDKVTLRLGVAMTPPELESFEAGLDRIREEHPNWDIQLEQTPQESVVEKINTQIAGDQLPDVVQIQGLFAQPWIRQGVFEDLTERAGEAGFDVDDFWPEAREQFRFEEKLYGIPNIVAPDIVYINKVLFDEAGLAYPTDDWTFEDMRTLALALTKDSAGNSPGDPGFDPANVVQWGLNVTPNNVWTRHFFLPLGADPCLNADCTEVSYTSAEMRSAMEWWATLASQDYAAPYDPYSGNQTGVPGDPFAAGLAAMGYNGYFLVGQMAATDEFEYDIVQPPVGPSGVRSTSLSTNGWAIPTTSEHKDAAWELLQELADPEFLAQIWAEPGHGVPARRSASDAILDPEEQPANQQAIIASLEYAEVFIPSTASAFEAYGRTADLFVEVMKGDVPLDEGLVQIETALNEVLAKDRVQ